MQPPPNMSPVVVVKDFGGYVNEYAAQTEIYRRTNREVRIHECHSACTMALGLPNVCVYPNSVFKFHQAYDPRDHVTNWEVSGELFATYPVAVRERLGTLTKAFTILRGEELIQLGVRQCGEPQPRIMIAQTTQRPLPDQPGGTTLSMLSGKLQGMVPGLGVRPELVPNTDPRAPRRRQGAVVRHAARRHAGRKDSAAAGKAGGDRRGRDAAAGCGRGREPDATGRPGAAHRARKSSWPMRRACRRSRWCG